TDGGPRGGGDRYRGEKRELATADVAQDRDVIRPLIGHEKVGRGGVVVAVAGPDSLREIVDGQREVLEGNGGSGAAGEAAREHREPCQPEGGGQYPPVPGFRHRA